MAIHSSSAIGDLLRAAGAPYLTAKARAHSMMTIVVGRRSPGDLHRTQVRLEGDRDLHERFGADAAQTPQLADAELHRLRTARPRIAEPMVETRSFAIRFFVQRLQRPYAADRSREAPADETAIAGAALGEDC